MCVTIFCPHNTTTCKGINEPFLIQTEEIYKIKNKQKGDQVLQGVI